MTAHAPLSSRSSGSIFRKTKKKSNGWKSGISRTRQMMPIQADNLSSILSRQYISKKCTPLKDGSDGERATGRNGAFTSRRPRRVHIRKQSRLRRFFQSSLLRIPSDLRKCQAAKPLATIHFAKQAPKRIIGPFGIRFGRLCASKPSRFWPWDKNETAGSRFQNSLRFCPRICSKCPRGGTWRDSAV